VKRLAFLLKGFAFLLKGFAFLLKGFAFLLLLALTITANRAGAATPSPGITALEARLQADPYDHQARSQLIQACRQSRRYQDAYYHAAWLTWLAPRDQAQSASGFQYLRDRRAHDRAAASAPDGSIYVVVTALRASQMLNDACLNGTLPQQTAPLRADVSDLVASAEAAEGRLGTRDPVARAALARAYLTLDDLLALEQTPASRQARPSILRKAASLASAVAAWLPDSPGAHRTLCLIYARRAELDPSAELWDLAIAEGERAQQLDPTDPTLPELLWGLHLRAGHWEAADTCHLSLQGAP